MDASQQTPCVCGAEGAARWMLANRHPVYVGLKVLLGGCYLTDRARVFGIKW